MNTWAAIRQKREGGECSIAHYAPRNPDGSSVKTGRFYIPALRLVHVFDRGELVGKFVSLYDGADGANTLLDGVLGKAVSAPAGTAPVARKAIWQAETRPRTGTAPWPFKAA